MFTNPAYCMLIIVAVSSIYCIIESLITWWIRGNFAMENVLNSSKLPLFYPCYLPILEIREGNTGVFLHTH